MCKKHSLGEVLDALFSSLFFIDDDSAEFLLETIKEGVFCTGEMNKTPRPYLYLVPILILARANRLTLIV